MVDHKNAERIRRLYLQLTPNELKHAAEILRVEFLQEFSLRAQQGLDVSLEPSTKWNPIVENFANDIPRAIRTLISLNPSRACPDPMYPVGFEGACSRVCFIMISGAKLWFARS